MSRSFPKILLFLFILLPLISLHSERQKVQLGVGIDYNSLHFSKRPLHYGLENTFAFNIHLNFLIVENWAYELRCGLVSPNTELGGLEYGVLLKYSVLGNSYLNGGILATRFFGPSHNSGAISQDNFPMLALGLGYDITERDLMGPWKFDLLFLYAGNTEIGHATIHKEFSNEYSPIDLSWILKAGVSVNLNL